MIIGKKNDSRRTYYQLVRWLISVKGIGRVKAKKIIESVDDPERLCYGDYEAIKQFESQMNHPIRALLNLRNLDMLRANYENNLRVSDGVISYWDPVYPDALKQVNDPPLLLYVKGDEALMENSTQKLAVVGTRVPTDYGRKYGGEVSKLLAQLGYVIVSGAAMGIDAVAHRAALEVNGLSIGVLGCGVDQIYPKQNGKLYNDLMTRGLLISEYEAGTQPHPIHFPERNRIIAGLSEACFVIEAAQKSGSLITAEMTMDLGRDVYALPGPVFSQKSIGCHELIQSGAEPIVSLASLKELFEVCSTEKHSLDLKPVVSEEQRFDHPVQRLLYEKGQMTFDEILSELKMNIPELMEILDTLENDKRVKTCGFLYHL